MQCPKCGLVQEDALECTGCGIVISKWKGPPLSGSPSPSTTGSKALREMWRAFSLSFHLRSFIVGVVAGVILTTSAVYVFQLIPTTEERLAWKVARARQGLEECRERQLAKAPPITLPKEGGEGGGPRYVVVEVGVDMSACRGYQSACRGYQEAYEAAGDARDLYIARVSRQK